MMAPLEGKHIVLAVTGSIASYKAAYLVRLLVKEGAEVKVLMTDAATAFVSPLTLATLSRNPVHTEMFEADQWNNHVDLGLWADVMIIAPATATTLSRCASGLAENMVVATYLSAKCPVMFAPAMDLDMWKHPSTRKNLEALASYNNTIIPVEYGELASGLTGDGRMAEPETIVNSIKRLLSEDFTLRGKTAMVTAGPTYEPIDPVRFLGNPSTGKMGIAIAESLAAKGAEVYLILGPTQHRPQNQDIRVHHVQTAAEMLQASEKVFPQSDIAVLSAAVADYTPESYSPQKIKKTPGTTSLSLKRTADIAATLGNRKRKDQVTIGFALETENAEANAREKLKSKHFDFVVLNSLEDEGAGFGHDTNKVSFLFPDNTTRQFELKSKVEVADDIVAAITELLSL